MKATMAQHAYINDLYNQLDTPYPKRAKVETADQASFLIDALKEEIEERANNGTEND